MSIIRTLASGMAGRTVARRLARVIPNPLLRYVVVTAATALAPMVARRIGARMEARRLARTGVPASVRRRSPLS